MEWIQSILNGDSVGLTVVVIFVALVIVLALMVWIFKKIAGNSSVKLARNRQPRLSVTDAAIVDDKRRLVLVRRDNVEHLLMIGGPGDIVIETNIIRAQQAIPAASPDRSVSARPHAAPEGGEAEEHHREMPARAAPAGNVVAMHDREPAVAAEKPVEHGPVSQSVRDRLSSLRPQKDEMPRRTDPAVGSTARPAASTSAAPTLRSPTLTGSDSGRSDSQSARTGAALAAPAITATFDENVLVSDLAAELEPHAADVELDLSELETEISQSASMSAPVEIRRAAPAVTATSKPANTMEDEMTRLLSELAGDNRKP